MINIIIWPNVEYVSTMLTGDSPVTLMPDTATNNVSIGLTSHHVYAQMGGLIIKSDNYGYQII